MDSNDAANGTSHSPVPSAHHSESLTTQLPISQESNISVTNSVQNNEDFITWSNVKKTNNIVYNENSENVGINSDIYDTLTNGTPYDFYSLFLDDSIIDMLVIESN